MAPISGGWSAGYLVEDKISHLLELYFPQIGPRPHSKKGIFRLIFKLISLSCRQLKRERLKLLEGWIWFKYRLWWKRLSLSWDRKKGFGQLPQVNNWRDSCLFFSLLVRLCWHGLKSVISLFAGNKKALPALSRQTLLFPQSFYLTLLSTTFPEE